MLEDKTRLNGDGKRKYVKLAVEHGIMGLGGESKNQLGNLRYKTALIVNF
jgi:hypothetical protein